MEVAKERGTAEARQRTGNGRTETQPIGGTGSRSMD
jgi:hypothetical protein